MNSENTGSSHSAFYEQLTQEPSQEVALSDETLLSNVSHLLAHPRELVEYCGPRHERLGWATWRFCDSSSSHCLHLLSDPSVPLDTRRQLTDQLKAFFREVFEPYCEPVMLASLKSVKHLNMACSLFWDIAPLGPETAKNAGISSECADLMRFQLGLSNPACRESALLGIEQWIDAHPRLMAETLQTYDIKTEPNETLQAHAATLIEIAKKHMHD